MHKYLLKFGVLTAFLVLTNTAWAFGTVDALIGNVTVFNLDGDTRAISVGSHIEAAETIMTGRDSEVLIKTDDDGVIFLKANSKLLVESFNSNGNEHDSFVARLLKGGLRSISGFIGKTAPKRHQLKTVTAVIGIRGTDYQVEVIENADGASTFAKVNTGEISLKNRGVSVNVAANQFAEASSNAAPHLLDAAPAGLFGANKLDEKIEVLIKNSVNEKALNLQEADQKRGGGYAASGETKIPRNCAGNNPAQQTLDSFIRAYEKGDIGYIQRRLDPSMIGYGSFLNGMMEDINAQKQIRFLIQNRNAQCGSDLAVINFRWEKRFLDLVTFQPRLQTGQASVLTYLKAGEWRLSGISGDNPFTTSLNRIASLIVTPSSASFASLPKTGTPAATSTFTGTASADIFVAANGLPAACSPDNATIHCNIGAFTGSGLSNTVSCSGATVAGVGFVAAGSIPFTSTGPASATGVTVLVNVPVTGNVAGQNASGIVTCSVDIDYPPGALTFTVNPTTIATQLKLNAPNQAGAGSVQLQAIANNGDSELLTLNETTIPGTFTLTGLNVAGGAIVPNNGSVTINGPTSITFKYTDPKTGAVTTNFFRVTP